MQLEPSCHDKETHVTWADNVFGMCANVADAVWMIDTATKALAEKTAAMA